MSFGLNTSVVNSFASKKGIVVSKIYAHQRKDDCQECKMHRQLYLDWGSDLYERNPSFWVAFNRLILGKNGVFDD